MGFQKILVGLERSDLGQQVFEQVLDLAKAYQGQIHFLHVLQNPEQFVGSPSPLGGFSDMGSYPVFSDPTFWESQVQAQRENAKHWLDEFSVQAREAGIVASWGCQVGEIGPVLCEMAARHQADLVVIGRRGLSGLAEALVGSVSNYVVHHAPCSVLVVQSGAE